MRFRVELILLENSSGKWLQSQLGTRFQFHCFSKPQKSTRRLHFTSAGTPLLQSVHACAPWRLSACGKAGRQPPRSCDPLHPPSRALASPALPIPNNPPIWGTSCFPNQPRSAGHGGGWGERVAGVSTGEIGLAAGEGGGGPGRKSRYGNAKTQRGFLRLPRKRQFWNFLTLLLQL